MTASLLTPPVTGIDEQMHALVAELYPICRSITGRGFRQTLRRLQEEIPLEVHEVPSGTRVLDWTVPKEWNIRDAYIKNSRGERVVDFRASNLHVVSYSVPVRRTMTLAELRPHLHSLPDHPDWIPYRTSYYQEDWGFCVTHRQLLSLPDDEYDVCIDSSLASGHLTYGEYYLPGERSDEILISCHACHPSLANDNLSGIAVSVFLAAELLGTRPRHSYRFLFVPGTIGPITWLALNEERLHRISHGLVLTLLGGPGGFVYKRSRRGDAHVDRAAAHVLPGRGELRDFDPYGYDERQYCSPGFDLPVGRLTRTPHGEFPEYHTSADDLSLVEPARLQEALGVVREIVRLLEDNGSYRNLSPKGEPQLGRRGLYGSLGGGGEGREREEALLWVLSFSDGQHTLLDIAERSGLPFSAVRAAADALVDARLLT
jgi:aminopeptidase-like protein